MKIPLFLAQTYSCGAYGSEAYNTNCSTASSTPAGDTGGGSSGTSTSTNGSGSTTNSSDTPVSSSADTTTNADTPSTNSKTQTRTSTTQQSNGQESAADQIAGTSWSILIPVLLGIAILATVIWMFIKKRRDSIPPSTPTIGF